MVKNVNEMYGAVPIEHNAGGSDARTETFAVPLAYAKDLMQYDLVKLNGDSVRDGMIPEISLWEQGDAEDIVGVVIGFDVGQGLQNDPGDHGLFTDNANLKYLPADTAAQHYVLVVTNPDVLLKLRVSNGVLAAADIGLNIGLTARTPRLGAYPIAGFGVDAATKATDEDLPLRIMRMAPEIGNDPLSDFAEIRCMINTHARRTRKTGV